MTVEARRSDLEEIVITSDNYLSDNNELIIKLAKPSEDHNSSLYDVDCVRFQMNERYFHITKESAREVISLLEELVDELE